MTQLNEKQIKLITKTIMPFLYQLQEMQDLYESKFGDKDQGKTQELPVRESEMTNENEVKPPC